MRRTMRSSAFIRRLLIMALAAALAAVILATTAFAQETTTSVPTSQPTATPTATQTPEPTSTPTSEPTSTPTPTPTPETSAPTTSESTTEQTTFGSTTEEPGSPAITVNPTQGPPGTTVTVTGSGWGYPEVVEVYIGSHPVDSYALETVVTDTNGNFRVDMTLSPYAPAGSTKVRAGSYYRSTEASFTITQGETGGDTGGEIDLAVIDLKALDPPLDQPICAGWTVTFQASIRNNGSKESGPFSIQFISDGAPDDDQERPSIPAGETHTHAAVLKNLAAGMHTVEFIVDPDKRIPESNEENNRGTFPFTLQVKDCSKQGDPAPKNPGAPPKNLPTPKKDLHKPNDGVKTSDPNPGVTNFLCSTVRLMCPEIEVSPTEGSKGTRVTVTGSNWEAGERVCISSWGSAVWGSALDDTCVEANRPGIFGTAGFSTPIPRVPGNVTDGPKTITAYSTTSSRRAQTQFIVTPDPVQDAVRKGAEWETSLARALVGLACKLGIYLPGCEGTE